mmetsp:Transcript_26063/g.61207  ORF Transcript_26063/g.61207 Transcript_26063/m.61207 type:complete len:121 (-) Transcript_26063:6-368(-)
MAVAAVVVIAAAVLAPAVPTLERWRLRHDERWGASGARRFDDLRAEEDDDGRRVQDREAVDANGHRPDPAVATVALSSVTTERERFHGVHAEGANLVFSKNSGSIRLGVSNNNDSTKTQK